MKKIIALALALVMAMVLLTACGETIVAPNGVYSTESGTFKAEFSGYDEKANVGNLTITRTLMEVEDTVSGTFAVYVNDPDDNTFLIDFTPNGGETIENFMVYGANDDVVAQYEDLAEIGGANSSYYAGEPNLD